jgi:hypothetical protein
LGEALPEIQWRNQGETAGGITKIEMPSLLLNENKYCIRFTSAYTAKFRQVTMW